MAGSCGAFCSFCGKCGKRASDVGMGIELPKVAPPGSKATTQKADDSVKQSVSSVLASKDLE